MTQPDPYLEEKALQIVEEALEIAPEQRLVFVEQKTKDNPQLQSRAKKLLLQAIAAEDDLPVTGQGVKTLLDFGQPSQIGNYKIQNEIGRGGMGVVYRGMRTGADFDHEVAIKLVAVSTPSLKLTQRLRDERRLLASLRHPNIAQFYDGGETEDGLPYFIMEYVKGQSLHHYLHASEPNRDTYFNLFDQICNGVAHAHKNLIIHRDLAPGNVLVSDEGEVKIIDFGVSHTIGSLTMEAQPSKAHTAGFTSPERLAGHMATTISDIYSLGELLKFMLKHLSHPRRSDIEAIIKKATANAPEDRYQSVELLQSDIEKYLQAKPVDAVAGGWQYRWKRNIALHKYAVAGLTSAFIGITVAVIVFANLYFRAVEAERQASERFDDVRELANFMIFDLYDALADITGTTSARESVADKALVYLDSLNASESAPQSLQLETLLGYRRLAQISGIPGRSNLGRRDEAQASLDTAFNGLHALSVESPNDINNLRALLKTAYSYARFEYLANDDSPATIEKANIAASAFQDLKRLETPTVDDYIIVTDAMVIHGNAHIWEKEGDKGLPIFLNAIDISHQAKSDYPDDIDIDVMIAKLLADYGDAQSRHIDLVGGSYDQAQASMDDGIQRLKKLIDANPE
ncbi:MAG: serine/threonine-protein kinase, partial [Pseudomonadota bacterium]